VDIRCINLGTVTHNWVKIQPKTYLSLYTIIIYIFFEIDCTMPNNIKVALRTLLERAKHFNKFN